MHNHNTAPALPKPPGSIGPIPVDPDRTDQVVHFYFLGIMKPCRGAKRVDERNHPTWALDSLSLPEVNQPLRYGFYSWLYTQDYNSSHKGERYMCKFYKLPAES